MNENLGSDHVIIKLSASIQLPKNLRPKRNFKKSDWQAYSLYIQTALSSVSTPTQLQDFYDLFENIIQEAANLHIPLQKIPQHITNKFTPKHYWNAELSRAVAERRLALTNLRRCPSPVNLATLKNKISNAQRAIRLARCQSFRNFCSSVDETSSSTVLWRKMRWIKGHHTSRQYIEREKAEKLLNDITPDFVCPPQPCIRSRNHHLESPITLQELENCIKSTDTAPGSDNISFSMIAHLPPIGKSVLLTLYNQFLCHSFVPLQWRNVKIVPIYKPGRDINSDNALRPISLISCPCKILHSILNKRLEWYFEKGQMFPDNMVGFRKSRSCLDNLTRLVTHIQTGFSKKLITAACFIDIDNAYNNVDVSCLIKILDGFGVGSRMCLYIWTYLKNRRLHVEIDNLNVTRSTGRGLAQGDPLSPLLFNIATLNICEKIQNVEISQYADDFVLYKSDQKLTDVVAELEHACGSLNSLLTNLGLVISPTKSKFCIFRKGYHRNNTEIKINNVSLHAVNHVKYLGLWLDSSLRWGRHIGETTLKVSKLINILKVLGGRGWGLHQKHIRRLYISLIRSRMDYASFLYDNSCKTNLMKLDRIQNQALRVIGGFIRSTPIHAMENELHLPPLQYRRRYLASKIYLKAKTFSDNKTITILRELSENTHTSYWTNRRLPILVSIHQSLDSVVLHSCNQLEMYSLQTWVSNIGLSQVICDYIPSVDRGKHLYDPLELRNKCMDFVQRQYIRFHKIYTDGSKHGQTGGAAFLDPLHNCNISIMHIELIAIAEALSYVKSINYDKFVILTDSKSSLQHLARCTSHGRGNPIAYKILESILDFQIDAKKVVLQWIPSHINIEENDIVDHLAKEACSDGIPLHVLPLFSDHIRRVKEECRMCWQEYFDERSRVKGIWYRTIQPQISEYPWIEKIGLSRGSLVTALRLRTGHIASNKFACLMGKVLSPNCEDCGVLEDVLHILCECVRNRAYRVMHFGVARDMNIGICNSLLANPASVEAQKLYKLAELGLD